MCNAVGRIPRGCTQTPTTSGKGGTARRPCEDLPKDEQRARRIFMMRIPFGSLPSMSALFLDYVNGSERVRPFYPCGYSIEAVATFARQRPALEIRHREQLCGALTGDPNSIKKLAAGAVVVITGQQPGLFTGPNYTILKALTVIKLAKALDAMGVPAAPVFWVAAEDHDYQEIESASVLDRDGGLQHVHVDLSNSESSPVGWLKLRED